MEFKSYSLESDILMRKNADLCEYISIYVDALDFTVHDPSKFINLLRDNMFREIPLDKFKYPMEKRRGLIARCIIID